MRIGTRDSSKTGDEAQAFGAAALGMELDAEHMPLPHRGRDDRSVIVRDGISVGVVERLSGKRVDEV